MSDKKNVISSVKDQIARVKNITTEDFADIVVGNTRVETISTGVTLTGLGIIGWGLLTDDHADVIEGAAVSAVGLSARALSFGYKIYKFLGGTPAPGDKAAQAAKAAQEAPVPVKNVTIDKTAAEEQLGFVEAAKTEDPAREVMIKVAAEVFDMNLNAFTQLEAKAKNGGCNKWEARTWNAIGHIAQKACEVNA